MAALLVPSAMPLFGDGGHYPVNSSFPHFRAEEIETGLKVGYAVLVADINGDGKPDIVVVDTNRVVWYENPTWRRRTIIEGKTQPDNVCIAAHDIDGDGRMDLVLGAGWNPARTKDGGTLQWLKQPKNLDERWTLYPIGTEPTLHRIRFADIDGEGKPKLIVAPLMGRGSTGKNNWLDGEPVRLLAFGVPRDPLHDRWVPQMLDQSMHVMHNFWPVPSERGAGMDLLTASYEGVSRVSKDNGKWRRQLLAEGNQLKPAASRGASEIKMGRFKNGSCFLATIEPWHGNQVVVYTPWAGVGAERWDRHVLDEQLRWGHAVWCADLDDDGNDELIVGIRDTLSDHPGERRGVRIYKSLNGNGTEWTRSIVEDGRVAVEDLAAADLDNDGRIDLVAAGRQTGNVRIYWNLGSK
jgi:hypothetical protein